MISEAVSALLEYHGLLEPVFPLARSARVRPQAIMSVDADTRVTVRHDPPAVGVERNGSGVTFWW